MDADRTLRILRQHLDTDRLLGVSGVPRADEPAQSLEVQPVQAPSPAAAGARGAASPGVNVAPASPSSAQNPPDDIGVAVQRPAVGDKAQALDVIDQQEVRGCTRCGLHATRTQTVFGEGAPDARLMIVGEGPGQAEDRAGRPFVGDAGGLLDKQIGAMGLAREQVYITNLVKCRPPGNRTPAPAEIETCSTYLQRQIEIVRPKIIIAMGAPAAKRLLQTTDGITRVRGNWGRYEAIDPPIPVMPTFHPAYLLRSYTIENRKKVWADLQAVVNMLPDE